MISREQLAEELKLRKTVRNAIKHIQEKKDLARQHVLDEEYKLRKLIRKLISETAVPEPEEAPHKSTGINVLEDLLKKVIPIIEMDFKKLTTSERQRVSFRAHILHAVENSLAPPRVTDRAKIQEQDEDDDITIKVSDEEPDEFIDVRGETEPAKEPTEEEKFGIEGEDETGRDMAFSTFKRIEANIVDSWEILYSDEDKELFYDYLITNLKLYFDKFEDELKITLPEPTTPEYEQEKSASEDAMTGEFGEEEEPAEEI
jgi:hypothetical protein